MRPLRSWASSLALVVGVVVTVAVTVALLAGSPRPALADTASHFGLNPRSMAMAGALTAAADDLTALYYNPAGLVQLPGMTAAAGVIYGQPFLSEDGSCVSMPGENSLYLQMGVPLSGRLKDHLAFGVAVNLPWGKYLNARLYKKHEPYFVLYDASVNLLQVRVGGALRIPWKPLSWLAVGGTLQMMGSVRGSMGVYAPFQSKDEAGQASDPDARLEAWVEMDVPTRVSFALGAMAFLGDAWRIGLSYRSAQALSVEVPLTVDIRLDTPVLGTLDIPVEGTASFESKYWPQQLSLGASFRWRGLLVAADLTWIDFSSYQIPYARVTINLDKLRNDDRIKVLLPDPVLLDPLPPEVEFADRLVPRIAAEYRPLDWLVLRAGYAFERSPLLATNLPIYDTDKHTFAVGARFTFLRPLGLLPGRLNLDLAASDLWYVGRGILGRTAAGHVPSFSVGVEVSLL